MTALFLPVGILVGAGLLALSSISIELFSLQLLWVGFGILLIFVFYFSDWRLLLNYRWLISGLYVLTLVLLVVAYFKGPVIRETRSWLVLGSFHFQPVELAKVALILIYAQFFSRRHISIARWKNIAGSFVLFALPAGLVALQPDLGSALILFGIWFGFLLFSGLPTRRVVAALLVLVALGIFGWSQILKDYQRERILGVVYPERSVLGINYSVIQSKIAIGSGGLLGKGYGQGSQVQLGFLPEPATDFIVSALIEEWGLVVGLVVLGAFLYLVFGIVQIGMAAEHNFEKFIALGAAMVFGLQFLLNTGSATGITPVIGITFPFLSYGGSSILTSFLLLSLVNAIRRKS
ncbi:hypothetical protein C4571_01805 [Candidatus Parcubacteria bacterium]|nr:MAG: hypothetical protein C4571_01805 [Candidatus Parcubacteria bacterium]